jgi:glycosyltransferase involved in cell wall biosynthesis
MNKNAVISTKKKHIMIIKSNTNDPDICDVRLSKEINTFKQDGYLITLLCWDKDCKDSFNHKGEKKEYKEIRLRLKTHYGITTIPFLPLWWVYVFFQLLINSYDIIHVINFDCVIPAGIAAKIKRKPFIYEMFDPYEDLLKLPSIIRNALVFIDKIFMRIANAVVVVDESRIKEFNGIPNKVVIIYNSPPELLNFSQNRRPSSTPFRLFYAGSLDRSRLIDNVIEAVKSLNEIELIIAGYGEDVKKIEQLASKYQKNVKFLGVIDYKKVIDLTFSSDLLFSFYDPAIFPLAKFASSNKLFEAMMCGKPILVDIGTAQTDIVEKENCGIAVDCTNVENIQNAIIKLKENRNLCFELGFNGRQAYEREYNWTSMEKRLLNLYEEQIK